MKIKIISGGQTGVDRAALDAAISMKIQHGGWCPKGRLAELGKTIPLKYNLSQTKSSFFSERTILNLEQSDATLILVPALPLNVNDGTVLTIKSLEKIEKPFKIIDLSKEVDTKNISEWIIKGNIQTLNIAGPRESSCPGIYKKSYELLVRILGHIKPKLETPRIIRSSL